MVAGGASARVSIASGGVLSIVGLGIAVVVFPQVWRYRGRGAESTAALTDDALAGPPV